MAKQLSLLRMAGLATVIVAYASPATGSAGPYSIDYYVAPYHTNVVDSWLFDVNSQGVSTGYFVVHSPGGPFTRAAVTYKSGATQLVAFGSAGGPYGLAGFAINNLGDVVGNIGGVPNFISATEPTPTPIEVLGSVASLFVAGLVPGGVNDAGDVLISTYPNDPADTPPNAFSGLALWNSGVLEPLTVLDSLYPYTSPPDPNDFNSGPSSSAGTSSVTHLNQAGQFAASIREYPYDPMDPLNPDDDVAGDNFTHAYIYDGQGGYSLLAAPALGDEIRPIDIDEAGTVFGWANDKLALWSSTGALQLILPAPPMVLDDVGYNGFPTVQRNNLGQVVGVSVDGGLLFYDPLANAWSDVTPSIAGLGTGTFNTIQGFNDQGQFVGLVRPPLGGGVFGYVVSPVPEPATANLFLVGLVGAMVCRATYCRELICS